MSIPKILHYCWFGGGKIPPVAQKCYRSWQKFFAGYEIKRWDESNFDVNINTYVKEAYDGKRYMYVSDFARLSALYEYGGVYLDVDCKVIKSFDPLLEEEGFTGFGGDDREIAACTMAFTKGHPFIKEVLDTYKNDAFIKDGKPDTTSINERMTRILESHGFKRNGKEQTVCGVKIYPMTYFCALSMLPDTVKDCKSKNTFSMTIWTSKELKRERSFFVRLAHKLGLNKVKRKWFK